ncbi:MAG: TonB family protein [Candidatus Acidiferrum sp.]
MSTVVKENQIAASIPEAAARPQPVALEVAVTVNGARTVAGSDKREPFSESTKTVLIFGHGAVVRLTSSVAPGQLLFLTNEKTKKEVVCQVVKSKNYHNVSGYVELEFTEPVAGFWGMRFPAAGAPQSSAPSTAATPAATTAKPVSSPVQPPVEQKAPVSSPAIESRPAASSPAVSTKVSLPDAKFAAPTSPSTSTPAYDRPSISSSQPPAPPQNVRSTPLPAPASLSTTSIVSENAKPSKVVEISRTKSTAAGEPISSAKISAAGSKSLLDSDEVKMPSWLEPLARNAAASSAAAEAEAKEQLKHHHDVLEEPDLAITEISAVPEAANAAVAAPTFGTRLLSEESDNFATTTGSSSKKGLVIGIAAGLLLLIGGGAWYMRQTAGGPQAPVSAPAPNTVAENVNSAPTAQASSATAPSQSNPANTITTTAAVPVATGATSSPTASSSGSASTSPEPLNASLKTKDVATNVVSAARVPAPQPKKPKLGEVNLSAPIVNSAAGGQPTASEGLNLEASSQPAPAGNLSSGLVSNSKQPVAPVVPLPVGGDVKVARLISSVPPVYPVIARSQRLAGNVQIDALVDVTGRVTSMKIVSGPPLLQKSAMDALSHWKYEPAQLNGQPMATHLTVTIQFKVQ